jgi:drug/metabolite transporter (DMT)-like permease
MSAYLASYVGIALSIRTLSRYLSIVEIAALRSVGSLAIAAAIVWASGMGRLAFSRVTLRDDITRSVLHMAGTLALIWSVAHLPLSVVATIEFSGPLVAAALVFLATRRRPEAVPAIGLAIIAIGLVLLLTRFDAIANPDIGVALGAVAALTTTNLMLAKLAARRATITIILVMHAIQLPLYLLLWATLPEAWSPSPSPERGDVLPVAELLLIAGAALALIVGGFVTQAALANASRHGTPLQLCAADALRVPLITLAAYLLLTEAPPDELLLPGLWVLCGVIVTALPRRGERGKVVAPGG